MRDRAEQVPDRDAASHEATSERADARQADGQNAARQAAAPGPLPDTARSLDKVDDASDDSFPASDAPPWTGTRAGAPRHDS